MGTAAIIGCAIFASCHSDNQQNTDILSEHIDTTVRPQDDFFDFANGGWIRKNPIPAAYKSWGIGNEVELDLYQRLKKINEDAASKQTNTDQAGGKISQKIAAFYKSGMDSVSLARQSIAILTPELSMIDSIKNLEDLIKTSGRLSAEGVSNLLGNYISQDDKNSSKMVVQFVQGGLGLPNRDYYLKEDARTVKIRAAYLIHIAQMFVLAGMDKQEAAATAQEIFNIEKQLATASKPLEALRDPYANYHKFELSALDKLQAPFNFSSYLQVQGIQVDSVVVGQPAFYKALGGLLTTVPLPQWKLYLKWHLLHHLGQFVNTDFEKENFEFYGKTMSGLKDMKPRWRRVLEVEENCMGEALGQLFVKAYFPEKAKQRYTHLVEDIRAALKDRIEQLDWMSSATKQKALYKLSKITAKVGYPDKWKDFSAMEIKQQPYVLNIISASRWWHQYEVNKLGKPVDRSEWDMTPQTYNAYYNPANNEIVLPAGIFTVPGKNDDQLDDAIVYGYAGASTIGHEITHGFDDQGRLYDANGNLSDWWTAEDAANFKKRAAVMVKQFNGYIPVDSLHINGEATLGENIADLGGILLGWEAFKKTPEYTSGKKIDGFTPAQRFFMGYALGWLYTIRPEALAQGVLTDVHSPAKFRVNGPFADVDAFYEAWNVKPGDSMYIAPENRVRIW
ncbi:putative endopeptidase [Arachidicoccus rhizosphaerae]|uniref:Putative endopeptidase n=2 Tax=Arachidicoccus rhizosphaerae TaxID=551991 RepID=A0A1H3W835_9BACT|nr:putative endopeptidase [Arachidicoccus rhizosphaerae]